MVLGLNRAYRAFVRTVLLLNPDRAHWFYHNRRYFSGSAVKLLQGVALHLLAHLPGEAFASPINPTRLQHLAGLYKWIDSSLHVCPTSKRFAYGNVVSR